MSPKEIQYGKDLVIPITDGRLSEALVSLDSNLDDRVTLEDFSTYEDPAKTMREMIARNMEITGLFLYPNQAKGLEKFFVNYDKLHRFRELENQWVNKLGYRNNNHGYKRELEFDQNAWKQIYLYISKEGEFSPEKLTQITYDVAEMLLLLSGGPVQSISEDWPEGTLDRSLYGSWYYNACALLKEFREPLYALLKNYQESIIWIGEYVHELECDGKGCPWFGFNSEVSLHGLKYLTGGFLASKNNMVFEAGGAFCFTGNTYLKLADGNLVPFKKITEETSVFSYDECDGDIVPQFPEKVIYHQAKKSPLWRLALKDEKGNEHVLSVTPDHQLLVERGLGEQWAKVGDLQDGDSLKTNSVKTKLKVDLAKTVKEEGVFDLYNLSFNHPARHPTYLVCVDQDHCLIAHNYLK